MIDCHRGPAGDVGAIQPCLGRRGGRVPVAVWRDGIVVALAIACASAVARPAAAAAQEARALVFDGVTVVDVAQGKLMPDLRVVVVGTRIRAIGRASATRVPRAGRIVDARGKYLLPGFWDMHVHLWVLPDVVYPLLLANGITGMREAGTGVPLDTLRRWRREVLAGTRDGPPRQLFAGPMLNDVDGGSGSVVCRLRCFHGVDPVLLIQGPAHMRRVADSLRSAGADFLKTHGQGITNYAALVAESRRLGIPFAGHLPADLGNAVFAVADSGQRTIEHFDGLTGLCVGSSATVDTCRPLAEHHRRHGTWNVFGPTWMVAAARQTTTRGRWARLRYWPDSVTGGWEAPPDSVLDRHGRWLERTGLNLDVAERAGLPMLIGTDVGAPLNSPGAVPGFQLHDDLSIYVDQGLTSLAALRAVTLNPARMLGATDSLGTVEVGKLADLVLLDADPLADIWNTTTIRAVVANGRYYDRAALDSLLKRVEQGRRP